MVEISKNNSYVEIFLSYSHNDEKYKIELEKHLAILKRQGRISTWNDRKIISGNEWKNEIDDKINTAKIILLLISRVAILYHQTTVII